MKKRLSVITTIASLLAFSLTSCLNTEELEVIQPQTGDKICFTENGLEEIAQAMTKTTATTSATLVSDGFYVSATTGSAGSESEAWTNAHFTKSGDTWIGDKYWPASNPSYHFYASNAQLTFNAAGATINANSNTDVVCAYLPESNYKTLNTLAFKHIFARLCRIDVAAQTGYTISNINVRITPKVSGTYNLRTGAGQTDGTGWSSTVNGSQQTVANATGANNNDIYMIPGQYTFTVSWTATASGISTNYTDKSVNIPIYGGSTNNLSLVLGSEINFGIDLQDYCNYDYRDNLDYLTFYSPEAQTITIYNTGSSFNIKELQYSTNQGQTWTTIISSQTNVSFSCNAGDIIWLKSNDTNPTASMYGYINFQFEKDTYVYGNVNSLINNSNTLTGQGFNSLFYSQTHLKTYQNKKISLPATTLTDYCYDSMFMGCTSLTTAPELPATTLTGGCYQQMFLGCTSLTTAPELPATTLTDYCYAYMFQDCTSLTTAPELPSTTLADYCYEYMFLGCTSLTTAPELPATTLANYCYSGMFANCTSLTTAPELPATTLQPQCYEYMFQGCTSLTTAPELPATTLTSRCYNSMFLGCTSLTTAPELPSTTLTSRCYYSMFANCTSLTTAPELPATTLAKNCYSSMFANCTSLNYIKANFTTTPSSTYTNNWVNNVAPTGTFVKNINATWNVTGNNGVPTGWKIGSAVPEPDSWMDNPNNYLSFKFVTNGQVIWKNIRGDIQYSKNSGAWTNFSGNAVPMSAGDEIWFRGTLTEGVGASNVDNSSKFITSGKFYASGNIQSLCNFNNTLQTYHFANLFNNCTGLRITTKKILILPATTLASNCYASMFYGCTSLTTAPELPATTLADYCYYLMFSNCTSLTIAPELPATTLERNCYSSMFYGCTSLTTAPELPATTLADNCYDSMFYGCTSLTTAPELPATTLANGCYGSMFSKCTLLTTAPELPATTLAFFCYSGMFQGCTSLTTAPELPATTLIIYCYGAMFSSCTSLTTAPELPATTLASNCYSQMFYGCTSLTTAPELPATTLQSQCYYGMFQGCTSLTTAPELPATTLQSQCYYGMFQDCTSLTTAPELPATTLTSACYQTMFKGCTSLTTAPELPATTLANYCYRGMFQDCTSLNYIVALFTTQPSATYTGSWVSGVAPTGTFVKNINATWDEINVNAVPTGWTIEYR